MTEFNAVAFTEWLVAHEAIANIVTGSMNRVTIFKIDDVSDSVAAQNRDLGRAVEWAKLLFEIPVEERRKFGHRFQGVGEC